MGRPHQCLVIAFLLISCSPRTIEPDIANPDISSSSVVYTTDSTEWSVMLFKQHMLYSEAVAVTLPSPWHIPTRSEASVLHTLTYPNDERFITCDGYTFGMPSQSVTKAGQKTKYSVLGLYIRTTVINIEY